MDKQTITLAIAITGAVTGILGLVFNFLNTWRAFDRDQVKLKVVPKLAISFHPALGTKDMVCIEVINTGYVPVTLSRVVFSLADGSHELHFTQNEMHKTDLPVRLEARESVTVYTQDGFENTPEFLNILKARAWTACGRTFDGTSPALKSFVKKARNKK